MWPFRKKSRADLAVEWLPRAIDVAAQKWMEFQVLKFGDDVSLEFRIMAFVIPLSEGLRSWKAYQSSPDAMFLLIAAKGIEKSGTHTAADLEKALGIRLPQ